MKRELDVLRNVPDGVRADKRTLLTMFDPKYEITWK